MLKKIEEFITNEFDSIVSDIATIATISSPPFEESGKISYLQEQLIPYKSLKHISIDKIGNLSAVLPGRENKNILLVAHTDTAIKAEPNPIFIKDGYIYGHGVCDNTAGVNALLYLLKFLTQDNVTPAYNLTFLFTVGEEGMGGKRGMKHFLKGNKNFDAVFNIESHDVGRITTAAVGQFRAKITINCEKGGHSWRDFGNPNPICILANIISDLQKQTVFKPHETTYTFSQISGGESINAIPTSATVLYEFRSTSSDNYKTLHDFFDKTINEYKNQSKDYEITIEIINDSLPVSLDQNHPIIAFTKLIHKELGIVSFNKEGNSDGDISLMHKIPTVTIGTSIGYKTHSINEYLEIESLKKGYIQVLYMVTKLPELFIR
jgi:tripeptide aminopeptidase